MITNDAANIAAEWDQILASAQAMNSRVHRLAACARDLLKTIEHTNLAVAEQRIGTMRDPALVSHLNASARVLMEQAARLATHEDAEMRAGFTVIEGGRWHPDRVE